MSIAPRGRDQHGLTSAEKRIRPGKWWVTRYVELTIEVTAAALADPSWAGNVAGFIEV